MVRLGDSRTNTRNTAVGSALPVYIDYLDRATGVAWMTIALPQQVDPSRPQQQPCTLAAGSTNSSSIRWFFDTEGLPSLSLDGKRVVFPCHTSPVGSPAEVLLQDGKTLAQLLGSGGRVDTSILFSGYTGLLGTATGLRTAVTVDGSEFWLAGISRISSGVRYLASPTSRITRLVIGQNPQPNGAYLPATHDVRGLALLRSVGLFVSSSALTEPNVGRQPWGGIMLVGNRGSFPTSTQTSATLIRGLKGLDNFQGFGFLDSNNIIALLDKGVYARVSAAMAATELPLFAAGTAPIYRRTSLGTTVQSFTFSRAQEKWVQDEKMAAPRIPDACYVVAITKETGPAGLSAVAYTAGRKALYRVVPATGRVTTIAVAAQGQLFRGVVLPVSF